MDNDETNMQPPGDSAAIPPSEPVAEAAAPPLEIHEPVIGGAFAAEVKAEIVHPIGGALPDTKVHRSLDVAVTPPPPAFVRLSWEEWCGKKAVPLWKGEAARHGRAWPIGQEVTEDEFNQALYDAFNTRIG